MNEKAKPIFIALLRSAMTGSLLTDEESFACTKELLPLLFSLAKKHDLTHLVTVGLEKNGLLDKESVGSQRFLQERIKAIYRYEQLQYELNEIRQAFQSESIPFIPLKGSVLREYYPEPWYRTSCDIDILVHEDDLEGAIALLKTKEYIEEGREYHDVSLYSPTGIHVELHFTILENQKNIDQVLEHAWQYAERKEGVEYEFSKEFFLFYMYAHASYHFLSGGCGVRTLLDIWVLRHIMNMEYSQAKVFLDQAGIYQFAKEIDMLSERCFTVVDESLARDEVLEYIVLGGVYGSSENHAAVAKMKSKSTFSYAWKRLFPSYHVMKMQYPPVKKVPILLPFFWGGRFFTMLFKGKAKSTVKELKTAKEVDTTQIEKVQEICTRLGLTE